MIQRKISKVTGHVHQRFVFFLNYYLGLIKQFLTEVDWGSLDYLFMDTPPGTSDEHLSIAQYMIPCQLTGAIIVTSPQEISLLDVRKEINFCRKVNIPIIGIVENMSWLVFFCFLFPFLREYFY